MGSIRLLACGCFLLVATSSAAFDLHSIERKIDKLPELTSQQPLYCLLVFGPEAKTRVWLVRDGDVLYADMNGNGDLTDAGERFESDAKNSRSENSGLRFLLGDVVDGELVHKALEVGWFNVEHLNGQDECVTEQFKQDPKYLAINLSCDLAIPAHRGRGIDGRVTQSATLGDDHGLLAFATSPQQAPILHFGGPWHIRLYSPTRLRIGREQEVYLAVGTPGLGPGTTTRVFYQDVVPPELHPRVRATFPVAGGSSITREYTFTRRCCGVNLYGGLDVPDEAVPGEAQVEFSLAAWIGAEVAPSSYSLKLLPPLPGPKLKPISARLKSKLEHQNPAAGLVDIRFSPDGTRLIAGDYPGGVVHTWDLSSGSRLVTIDAGEGLRSSSAFEISPDWQRIYTSTNDRGKFERVERDGKQSYRATYRDELHIWDANTGEKLQSWGQEPQRRIVTFKLTPDGKHLLVQEETPGEFDTVRPRALTLLETDTLKHRELFDTYAWACCFSADSRLAATSIPLPGEHFYHEAMGFFSLPDYRELGRAPLGENQHAYAQGFSQDGRLAFGQVTVLPARDDFNNMRYELRIWEVATAQELLAIRGDAPKEQIGAGVVSPDGKFLTGHRINRETGDSRFLLIDLDKLSVREIRCETGTYIRGTAFHPAGAWVAVSELTLPQQQGTRDLPVEMLEQPRVRIYEVASGKLLETIVAPQSYQVSMAWSPDGQTLATASQGAVLLWDMSIPPGEVPAPAEVGQTIELVGTANDGQPLDSNAYRGKVTLVSFWATWCQPCIAEFPELMSIYHDMHDRGFEVIGISLDEADTDLKSFVKNQSLPWTVLQGTTNETAGLHQPLARRLGVTSVPRSFLLDGSGRIISLDPPIHELKQLVEMELSRKAVDK